MSATPADLGETHWYHTIDLGNGTTTRGDFDLRSKVPSYGLPDRLEGQRALDVGCSSGFWSFEMERRGASVTAVDVASENQDIWPAVQDENALAVSSSALGASKRGHQAASPFRTAHELLRSRVEFREMSVYDLDPRIIGTFNLVFCGSLLMHLTDPFRALQKIASVARGLVIISSMYVDDQALEPRAVFKLSPRIIWTPNPACLRSMMREAGLGGLSEHARVTLRHLRLNADVPHVVFHGRGGAEPNAGKVS